MSSILDALRKSEHERQMASGQSTSMLYPAEIKPDSKSWLFMTLLAFAVLIILVLVLWPGSRPAQEVASNTITNPASTNFTSIKPSNTIVPLPQEVSKGTPDDHSAISKPEKSRLEGINPENMRKKIRLPIREDTQHKLPAHPETMPEASAKIDKTVTEDPLKGLPTLNITGYIHNEQSGSLAMINNQLIHEGEEISPGLRLVKILDDKAVFSYKGYVFTR